MITKQLFRSSIEEILRVHKTELALKELGVDISETNIVSGAFKLFEILIESYFSEADRESIIDWVYDRVFDIQGKSGSDLDVKINYIYKDNKVVVDNFDSLCEYYGIK